jgi:GNAT superfamily N-acetyltransferase
VDFTIRKLEAADPTDGFDCGDKELNEYLTRYAYKNQERHMYGATYVAICPVPPGRVIGYFTIANTLIPRQGLPEKITKGSPKYEGIPAILLARFAVDKKVQGKKIGETLLARCLDISLYVAKLCGARYIITDAYDSAATWYERYNFRVIAGSSVAGKTKMFVDLKVIRAAIELKKREEFAN